MTAAIAVRTAVKVLLSSEDLGLLFYKSPFVSDLLPLYTTFLCLRFAPDTTLVVKRSA
jgi:hypothetical protein